MNTLKHYINLVESADTKLVQEPLPYSKDELDPVLSQDALNYHYGKLARAYVDRYNKGEGDLDFNKAGAVLHNLYFAQFKKPGNSRPMGTSEEFINKHFESFTKFKDQVEKTAMGIQGSGWVYLAKNGQIKTITNHQIKTDIVLLIDWWEHAWALDYQHDKQRYLNNLWRIINWYVINDRLQGQQNK